MIRIHGRVGVALAVLGVFAASVAFALDPLETHMTPPSQPPITAIEGRDLTPVQALFNRDVDRPRIFLLLSPT